ncbi:MAG: glycoside hydrolase family 2, partial [Proteobacteria bacterium]
PHDLAKPRGKQDWQLNPHSIWYPRTSGIWQTVWVEELPATYIDRLLWTPHLERWEIGCEAFISGKQEQNLELRVRLSVGPQTLADDRYTIVGGEVHRRIALSDPGIDDYRNELLWSPEKPTLIDAQIDLIKDGVVIDTVKSYTALRKVAIQRDRFILNNRPYYLRLILDQGYWPETFMTPPSQEAIKHDIAMTKAAGFNGVRKHQKIEDPNFLYWADVMGLMVWEEMPSAYRFTNESVRRIIREWTEVIDRDSNHPCIVTWVPFNESWGVPDLPERESHRECVQALYSVTKTLDSTRPVIGNDGWEASATDILGIHDYDAEPMRILKRYGDRVSFQDVLSRGRPGGRLLTLDGASIDNKPIMLTEFGGIAYRDPERHKGIETWGYSVGNSSDDFRKRYENLLGAINRIELFAGFCYTQLTDTFQEANGL